MAIRVCNHRHHQRILRQRRCKKNKLSYGRTYRFCFFIIGLATLLPPAPFWVELYKEEGLDINQAYGIIFRQGLGIILGSLTAFLIGQLLDVFVFHRLRRLTGPRMLWLRATGSTLFSQLIDSFVVLFIAFYIFGKWNLMQVVSVGLVNYFFKFLQPSR